MSVIVKGMEMPEKCGLCDLFHAESPMHCTVVKGYKTVGAPYGMPRPDWCPLVALPDHHGRLVDADALRDRLRSLADDGWNKSTTTSWAEAFSECEDMVDEAPTIEPERKKGRWIKKTIKKKIENDYSCSECGRHVSVMRGYDVRLVYPFCHCGAEMLTEDKG